MMKRPRIHDEAHLAFIRKLPCICCQDNTATQAAHIRMSDARIAKVNPGVGAKPDDKYTLPLCGECHAKQHSMNEGKFWEYRNIDPVLMSLALYSVSGNIEEAERIIYARVVNVMAAG